MKSAMAGNTGSWEIRAEIVALTKDAGFSADCSKERKRDCGIFDISSRCQSKKHG